MHGQVLESCIFIFFVLEMLIKMIALGMFGFKGSYLSNNWNKFDVFIISGELVSHSVFHLCLQISLSSL